MAEPSSSSTPSRSNSTTTTPENMRSSQAAQSAHTSDITNNSTTPPFTPSLPTPVQPQPSLQTLADRQALFDSSTNNWVQVPPGLILLPAVEDTNANTTTSNSHLGMGTDCDRSVEQEHSSSGLNDDGNTANTESLGDALQNVQVPVDLNQGFCAQYLQDAREALNRLESSLNAPFGYDDQGNAIVWEPINEFQPDWDFNLGGLNGLIMQNETGVQSSTLHHEAPQTLARNPALIIEVDMSEDSDANTPANAHTHDDGDANVDADEEE
ncbi:hypothetical protein MMC22_001022 [Lobaria immixta]|nr:hypothetical protein [Lobaria immixta]